MYFSIWHCGIEVAKAFTRRNGILKSQQWRLFTPPKLHREGEGDAKSRRGITTFNAALT